MGGPLLLGVNGAPAIGFPNGKRLVRWLGFRPFLDDPDPRDPKGRTFRYLLAIGHYSTIEANAIRARADALTRRRPIRGVTAREVRSIDEPHNDISRAYQWDSANDFIAEMDAEDARKILSHPVLGQEFAYADIETPLLVARRPNRTVRDQWASEQPFQVPRGAVPRGR